MDFICKRKDLVSAVTLVEKAVPVKSPIPIMEGIYIEAKEDSFKLVGNSMDMGIECSIPAQTQQKGLVVVKANLFSSAVKRLPDYEEDVHMVLDENDNIKIACGNAKFDFATASAEDFPLLPFVEDDLAFDIPENKLKSMIRQTVYAVATKEDKPVLTGVFFDIEGEIINIVGCDGYRVAIRKENIDNDKNIQFILPGKNAKELLSMLGEDEEPVHISVSSNNVKFKCANRIFVSRIIAGEYLNYKAVENHKNTLTLTVDTKKILNSVDRAAMIVNESAKAHVLLTMEDDNVFINCESTMGKVNDKFTADMQGEPMRIAFNPRYLLEAFKNIEDDTVLFSFSTPVTPTVIKPIEGDKFKYIVLPVRIR